MDKEHFQMPLHNAVTSEDCGIVKIADSTLNALGAVATRGYVDETIYHHAEKRFEYIEHESEKRFEYIEREIESLKNKLTKPLLHFKIPTEHGRFLMDADLVGKYWRLLERELPEYRIVLSPFDIMNLANEECRNIDLPKHRLTDEEWADVLRSLNRN